MKMHGEMEGNSIQSRCMERWKGTPYNQDAWRDGREQHTIKMHGEMEGNSIQSRRTHVSRYMKYDYMHM